MTETEETWVSEYDADTGQHRIYEAGELIACVGNIDMDFNRQEELAETIRTAPNPRNLDAYRAQIRAKTLEEAETHLSSVASFGDGKWAANHVRNLIEKGSPS